MVGRRCPLLIVLLGLFDGGGQKFLSLQGLQDLMGSGRSEGNVSTVVRNVVGLVILDVRFHLMVGVVLDVTGGWHGSEASLDVGLLTSVLVILLLLHLEGGSSGGGGCGCQIARKTYVRWHQQEESVLDDGLSGGLRQLDLDGDYVARNGDGNGLGLRVGALRSRMIVIVVVVVIIIMLVIVVLVVVVLVVVVVVVVLLE